MTICTGSFTNSTFVVPLLFYVPFVLGLATLLVIRNLKCFEGQHAKPEALERHGTSSPVSDRYLQTPA